ncbi:ribosomal protein S18-alanine N-acetyltransferase [Nevskia soli]|uniref:ribosomal protein S18-alanine N-acetyltransferase n=1 Tax=Nevskia soli TaxID=418856 RepID=UPI0004A6B8F1|nr:ribosomal protein S18-alanine N-acetyltransferase [Nevskia soli]
MSAQPKPAWQILPMHVSHLPQVLEIEQRAYPFPWSDGIFRDCLKAGYSGWILIDRHGVIVGYALMSMAVDEAHVLNLCIDPSGQRQGLGRMLLEHMIMLARAANATIVLLEVRKSNKAAIHLYESQGFQRLGLRKGYYPAHEGREDALVLGFDIV